MTICSLCECLTEDPTFCAECQALHCQQCFEIIDGAGVDDAILTSHDNIFYED